MERMDSNRFLTKREAAAELRITDRTIDNYRKRGLRVTKPGGIVRIERADLDAFLEKHKHGDSDGKH